MGRHVKGDPGWSLAREERKRKPLSVTLSDDERATADKLAAEEAASLSSVVATALATLAALPRAERRRLVALQIAKQKR